MFTLQAIKNKIPGEHGRRMAMFGGVGVLCTLTDLVFYAGLVSANVLPVVANFFAFLIANIQGYALNGSLTFRKEGKRRPLSFGGYLKYFSGYSIALIIASLIIWRLADQFGPWVAKLIAVAVTAIWTYLVSVLFVYRDPAEERHSSEST